MKGQRIALTAILLALPLCSNLWAGVSVFSDNFDSYGYALNWTGGGIGTGLVGWLRRRRTL